MTDIDTVNSEQHPAATAYHVQVFLDLPDESGPAVLIGVEEASSLGFGTHAVDDVIPVLDREEVRDLS